MEISRALADDSNDVSHLSISIVGLKSGGHNLFYLGGRQGSTYKTILNLQV